MVQSTTMPALIQAPVSLVTLLEDRAQVQRVGQVNLTPGLWRVNVEQVAPVLSDKSLRAEFVEDTTGARVDDVRVQRQMLVKQAEQPAEIEALLVELRSLLNTFNQTTENRQHLEHSFLQINTILNKALQELPIDAVWGQIDPRSWREQLQTLFKQMRELRTEVLGSYYSQEQLRQKIQDLIDRLNALSRPNRVYVAQIVADLAIFQAGEHTIAFNYVVPNALWRPWHQARLLESQPSLHTLAWRTDGCVWQRTGEDWQNVDLVFSTARASLGTEPPLLRDDVLTVKERAKHITVQGRDQQVQTTGLGTATLPETVELPGVDDGGEVRHLRSLSKATIPSDGRPYRVPLFSFEAAAVVKHVLLPEIACQVVLKSEQTNATSLPILAGPVDLIRSSGFVGRTSVLFIAPNEQFALGWGPDPALRVQRTQQQKQEQNPLTRWNTITYTTKLFLSNIGAEPKQIRATERVPVSELEQVQVEVIDSKTSDRVQPDANGFCTWRLTLEPYSQHQVSLVHKISTAPDVRGNFL